MLIQCQVLVLSVFTFAPSGVCSLRAVASHADTGRSKGWALVRFERNEHALQAINQYDQQCFMHRQLSVRLDRASIESGNLFRVYVGNLPFEMTDEELQEKFACFDAVDSHVKVTASGR